MTSNWGRLTARRAFAREAVTECARPLDVLAHECLVDDRDARRSCPVAVVEVAALEHHGSERLEVASAHGVEPHHALLLGEISGVRALEGAVPAHPARGREKRRPGMRNAGHRCGSLAQAVEERHTVGWSDLAVLRIDGDDEHGITVEPGVHGRQRREGAHEQACRYDQDEREGHLCDDQTRSPDPAGRLR